MNGSSRSRFAQRSGYSILALAFVTSTVAFGEIKPSDCARAAKYSDSRRGMSMLVMQNGRTVFEHYAHGGMPELRSPIFSGTKSFWGIAALIAVQRRLFQLDDRVADTITEWKNDPGKSQMTIRELLNFTDGIEGASFLHRESIRDRNGAAIRLPVLAPPGSVFTYGPSHLQIFSELLRRKLNGRSTVSFIKQQLLDPLRLSDLEFKKDRRGNPLPASGFELTAREWARLGELVLGRGNYHGRHIVSPDLLRQAFTGSNANPSYGFTFWLNAQAPHAREVDMEKEIDLAWERAGWSGTCICTAAPPDTVVALGSGYQRLFIIPSLRALIVRQGWDSKFSDAYFLRLVLGR
ncbi:MAG TPA: serine hydrolase domain-containing protein [Chthoniobacterales bacterium]|nr:serine hydrolase domain-containing protein [Chthoniobacterales bacterium]